MIVIDVGCARYGGDYSIERLVEEFHPDRLIGYDPAAEATSYGVGTAVIVNQAAAWIYDGEVGFFADGLNGHIDEDAPKVPCVNLARVIHELPDDDIVLKIDAEGAEYDLLEHLIATGADRRLTLAWVEWHEPDRGRKSIEKRIDCEFAEWRW